MEDLQKFISDLSGNETSLEILNKAKEVGLISSDDAISLKEKVFSWKQEDAVFKNSMLSMVSYTANDTWMNHITEIKSQNRTMSHEKLFENSEMFSNSSLWDKVIAANVLDKFTPAQVMKNGDFEDSNNRNEKKVFFTFKDGVYRSLYNFCSATVFISKDQEGKNILHLTYRGTDLKSKDHMANKDDISQKPAGKMAGMIRAISYFMGIYPDIDKHSDHFAVLERSVLEYVENPANKISSVQVSGHSLGGSMTERFAKSQILLNSSVKDKLESFTFGAPSTRATVLGTTLLHIKRSTEVVLNEWADTFNEITAEKLHKINRGVKDEDKIKSLSLWRELSTTPEFSIRAIINSIKAVPKFAKIAKISSQKVIEEFSRRSSDASEVLKDKDTSYLSKIMIASDKILQGSRAEAPERSMIQFADSWDLIPRLVQAVTSSASIKRIVAPMTDSNPIATALLAGKKEYSNEIKNVVENKTSRKKLVNAHTMTRYTLNTFLAFSPLRDDKSEIKRFTEPSLENLLEIKSKPSIMDCEKIMHKYRAESKVSHDSIMLSMCKNLSKFQKMNEIDIFKTPTPIGQIELSDGNTDIKKISAFKSLGSFYGKSINLSGDPQQINSKVNANEPAKEEFAKYRGFDGVILDLQYKYKVERLAKLLNEAVGNTDLTQIIVAQENTYIRRDISSFYKPEMPKIAERVKIDAVTYEISITLPKINSSDNLKPLNLSLNKSLIERIKNKENPIQDINYKKNTV